MSVTYSDVESKLRDTLRYEEIVRQSSPHFHDTDNSSINLIKIPDICGVIRWNLRTRDTLGLIVLSLVYREVVPISEGP